MNLNACLDLILARVGRAGSTSLRPTALAELALLQAEYEESPTAPWFLLQAKELVLVPGQSAYTPPAGFLRFDDSESYVSCAQGQASLPVEIVSAARIVAEGSAATGVPLALGVTSTEMLVYPVPDAAYVLTIYAVYSDSPPVDAATENLWAKHAPSVLVSKCAFRLAKNTLHDDVAAAALQVDVMEAEVRLFRFGVARSEAGRTRVYGDEEE